MENHDVSADADITNEIPVPDAATESTDNIEFDAQAADISADAEPADSPVADLSLIHI